MHYHFFYKSLLVYNSSFLTCVLPGKKTCHLCRPTFHVHKAYITYVADVQVNSFSEEKYILNLNNFILGGSQNFVLTNFNSEEATCMIY